MNHDVIVVGPANRGSQPGSALGERAPASSTAEWVALFRAAEAILPGDRSIYRDPDARLFVRDSKLRPLIARYQRAHSGRLRAAADWVSVAEAAREADGP